MRLHPEPNEENSFLCEHIDLLRNSYQVLTGRSLVSNKLNSLQAAKQIFFAPYAVVSHDTSPDPIFNYANRIALELFEIFWEEFTVLPSRMSAEVPNQEERSRQLEIVRKQGFIDNYSGIRISKNGKRFAIEHAVVWNLIDALGNYRGQAATFNTWRTI